MLRRFLLLPFLWMILFANPVNAQVGDIVIDTLTVSIQPEYDRPGVLIIYDITFSPDTPLQSRITMHIPLEAGRPNAVAYYGQDDGLYDINYDADLDGDWLRVSFNTPTQKIRLEYYDPSITRRGDKRTYVYRWSGDYIVNDMVILVQQPRNATRFTVQPEMGFGFKGNDGLIYYQYEPRDSLQDGRIFTVTLTYDKPDDSFSAQLEPVEPVQSLPIIEPQSTQPQQILPWVFGVLGVLLITGGWFWYWRSGQSPQKPVKSDRRRAPRSSTARAKTISEDVVYCHKCGRRAVPADRYCRDCGTQLIRNG